ncbi:hypothetical protein GY45DRAFT_1341131, partial [Cubamyces sp. BRFM 1775]
MANKTPRTVSLQTLSRTKVQDPRVARLHSSTWVSAKLSSFSNFRTASIPSASAEEQITDRRIALAREMTFVEFPHVSEWLDTCLPGDDLPVNIRRSVVPFEVALDRQEVGMYPGLCKGFNDLLTVCGMDKTFVMKITGAHKDTVARGAKEDGDENKDRPDLVMYPDTDEARESFAISDDPARTIWAHSEFMIEAKYDLKLRPFSFDKGSASLPDGQEQEKSRGQILECFAYIISVLRHKARLIRVDRTAALVSEPFDYVENPLPLATFVYRYVNASPAERGFDPTATLATQDEANIFRALPARYSNDPTLHSVLRKATTPGWPIFKLSITGRWSSDDQP